jgi:MoaA/NifB/PqqE/SkfB family radical SAM enzyme
MPTMLELELTQACQLACTHCFSESSPGAGHGSMRLDDWLRVIDQAPSAGFDTIQLIGGEPTVSPHWKTLLTHTLSVGMRVQVYSNLYSVSEHAWATLAQPGVALATSYYSDDPAEHDAITTKPGSHARTRANMLRALELGIPVKAGIVRIHPGQRAEQAKTELERLGIDTGPVTDVSAVGRANPTPGTDADVNELCGQCGIGKAAVLPDGTVTPCVLGRALRAGNVTTGATLAEIITSPRWHELMATVPRRGPAHRCVPDDSNDCRPASTTACKPAYPYAPSYPTIRLTLRDTAQ